jgi:hypothetical protein
LEVSRGPAMGATVVGLALVNVGLAMLIVALVSTPLAPVWVCLVLLVAGLATCVGAVLLWRQYLIDVRQR